MKAHNLPLDSDFNPDLSPGLAGFSAAHDVPVVDGPGVLDEEPNANIEGGAQLDLIHFDNQLINVLDNIPAPEDALLYDNHPPIPPLTPPFGK